MMKWNNAGRESYGKPQAWGWLKKMSAKVEQYRQGAKLLPGKDAAAMVETGHERFFASRIVEFRLCLVPVERRREAFGATIPLPAK